MISGVGLHILKQAEECLEPINDRVEIVQLGTFGGPLMHFSSLLITHRGAMRHCSFDSQGGNQLGRNTMR